MEKERYTMTSKQIASYAENLREQERSENTVSQYEKHLTTLLHWLDGKQLTKLELIGWKSHLTENYATSTVNTMLAAVNGFLRFMGWNNIAVKQLKMQKALFRCEEKELSCEEYQRLVHTAVRQGNTRLSLLIQAICATGIRVSELKHITVEAVQKRRTEVFNKGKHRMVFLPENLCHILKKYIQKRKIKSGPVFITRTGNPLDRSNIWRAMKSLCKAAGVSPSKVFPHNLRHLFAVKYYAQEKDAHRLADILGHSSINTTRIYTAESGWTHAAQVGRLGLVITT